MWYALVPRGCGWSTVAGQRAPKREFSKRSPKNKTSILRAEGVWSMKTQLSDQVVHGRERFHWYVSAVVVMALFFTMFVEALPAQGIFGRISGTITDPQGGVVAGAKISIVSEDTKLERVAT